MTTLSIDSLFFPLDRARLVFLKALGPLAGTLAADRTLRVTVLGFVGVTTSLALASTIPLWLLLVSPVLLGVPHVVSDLRYLVVRRGLHRRPAMWLFAFAPLLSVIFFDAGVLGGLAATFGALVVARATLARRLLGLAVVAALFALARFAGHTADVVFAHAHNVIAVVLWWLLRPRTALHAVPLVAFVLASAAILVGVFDPLVVAAEGLDPIASDTFSVAYVASSVAPGVDGPLATRLVLFFAFAQSVHYAMWLRLVPEDDRPRETPRTFRASYHALVDDLGKWVFGLAVLAALAVACWAVVDLVEARDGYLRMALVHGHLELVALALVVGEGRRYLRRG